MYSFIRLIGSLVLPMIVVAMMSALLRHPAEALPMAPERLMDVPPGGSIGQTFVARHADLRALTVYLGVTGGDAPTELVLHLRASALGDQTDLRTARLSAPVPIAAGWYRFSFPPILQSRNQSFYFFIEEVMPSGAILSVGAAAGSAYGDGALYLSHQPQDAQTVFRAEFGPGRLWYGALSNLSQFLAFLLVVFVLFVVPGWALQMYLMPLPRAMWKEQLGVAAGISLSLYPLILLWAKVVGIRPGPATVWVPVIAGLIAIAWQWWRSRSTRVRLMPNMPVLELADMVWIAAMITVVCTRLALLSHLDAPMWGDSVQHAVIGQLMVDHGGLFDSWLPYTPYETLTVHFGFHTVIAALMWLTGAEVLAATLQAGQIVNLLAILTLVPLATRLVPSRWAGIGVVVVAGLLSPLPNQYVNWGRYSQLLGQTIMPVAVWFLWRMFDEHPVRRWQTVMLAAVTCVGTFLAYYRMPHYVAALILVVTLFYVAYHFRHGWRVLARPLVSLAATGALAAVLVVPWLLHIRGGALAEVVEAGVTRVAPLAAVMNEYAIFRWPNPLLPLSLVVAAAPVTLWALVRGKVPVIILALWTLAVLLLPASQLIRVPGANKQQGFSIMISLYLLVGLLVGAGIDTLLGGLAASRRRLAWLGCAMLLLVSALPTYHRLGVVDPTYRILAPADIRAMEWVREHIPPDARFLVDGFLIYNGSSAVGSDGGWWLPLLTRRQNTMPPQYALLNERPDDPRHNRRVVDWVKQIRAVGVTSAEGLALLCRTNITHVYVGQGQGRIAVPPPEPMLPLAALEGSPAFTPLYRQDKIGIFALNSTACR